MLALILAQSTGEGGGALDPFSALIASAGVAGIWLVTILMGKMHPDSAMKREQATTDFERERANKAEAMRDELTSVYVREVLPALSAATAATAAATKAMTDRAP